MATSEPRDAEGNAPPIGCYLKSYDAEAYDGRGAAEFTGKLDEALLFDTAEAAVSCWRAVPANRPLREDGQPNRPLTAMTMEFLDLEVVRAGAN